MTRSRRLLAGMAFTLMLVLTVLGCGESGPPMGDVEGTVTIDGAPAAMGSVTFTPTDGVRPSGAGDIKDGKYALKVAVGPCKVQLRVLKKVGEKKAYNTPESPLVPIYDDALGAEFHDKSTLTFDVAAGKATKNWETKSRVKK